MPVYAFRDLTPQIHPDAWVAENATIVGNVVVEAGANIWYGCVLRNEFRDPIVISEGASVQDNTVMHTDPGLTLRVGRRAVIGHAACIHGAILEDGCLIGQHATVLNGAVIGEASIIAAGALVRERQVIPPGVLAAGVPAKVMREVDDASRKHTAAAADFYFQNARAHAAERTVIA